jgi:hypothetical protein
VASTLAGVTEEPTHIIGITANVNVIAHPPTIEITKGEDESWQAKWLKVTHHLDEIHAAYSAGSMGNVELEATVLAFFTQCFHLWQALVKDKTLTITAVDTKALFDSSDALQWCREICNGDKHGDPLARIKRTPIGPDGASVEIESVLGDVRDAEKLAEACVADWRTFFRQKGITEP